MIEIDPEGDLRVNVIEYDYDATSADGSHPFLRQAAFKVSRKILAENSTVFKKMLTGNFAEAKRDAVTIEEDTVASVELWFRTLHGCLDEDCFLIEIKEVWEAIQVAHKYNFHMEKLEKWYKEYYDRLDIGTFDVQTLTSLMFPSQEFDYPNAFSALTQKIAYEAVGGDIIEHNPTRHRNLHVEGRVFRKLLIPIVLIV